MSTKLLLLLVLFLHGISAMNMTISGYISCTYNQKFSYRMDLLQRRSFIFPYFDYIDQQSSRDLDKWDADLYRISGTIEESFWSSKFDPEVRIYHTCTKEGKEIKDYFYLKQDYSTDLKSAELIINIHLPHLPRHKEGAIVTHVNGTTEEWAGETPEPTQSTNKRRFKFIFEQLYEMFQEL